MDRFRKELNNLKEFKVNGDIVRICVRDESYDLKFKPIYGSNIVYKYPSYPPLVIFLTPIWHPNISTKGTVCLPLFNEWSPLYTIRDVIDHIIHLINNPILESPLNLKAAMDYKKMNK